MFENDSIFATHVFRQRAKDQKICTLLYNRKVSFIVHMPTYMVRKGHSKNHMVKFLGIFDYPSHFVITFTR